MTNDVRPSKSSAMFACTARSDSVSSALVASSKIRIGGSLVERPRDRDALALAARQREARLADLRLVAQRQAHDEVVRVRDARCSLHALRGRGSPEPNAMLRAIVSSKR